MSHLFCYFPNWFNIVFEWYETYFLINRETVENVMIYLFNNGMFYCEEIMRYEML